MIKTIRAADKNKKVVYWLATALVVTTYLAIGIADLVHSAALMAGLAHLGYPRYLATILGIWKVLGAAAILAPGFPRLKEWAYAGMFFNLTGAALSHAAVGDARNMFLPLALLVTVLISMAMRPSRSSVAH